MHHQPTLRPPLARLWEKVDRPREGCWLPSDRSFTRYWDVNLGRAGWGLISAHVLSWLAHFPGPIPEGYEVCHLCDTPACVRPDHLFLATHRQNVLNMRAKGRHPWVARPPNRWAAPPPQKAP